MTANFLEDRGEYLYATVDLGVYDMTALLKVVHRFTDRCYLHLQTEADGKVGVRFRSKVAGRDCSPIASEFLNELLDQTLRVHVAAETEPVRNLILAHALSKTALIHPELETAEPLEDPNGIARLN